MKIPTFWWLEQTFAQEVAMLSGKWMLICSYFTQIDTLPFMKSGRLIYSGDQNDVLPLSGQTLSNGVRNKVRGSLEPSMLKDYWDTWPAQTTWKSPFETSVFLVVCVKHV